MPAFFLAAVGMVLLYGTGDYPDNLVREVQFALPALALAWAWPPRGDVEDGGSRPEGAP